MKIAVMALGMYIPFRSARLWTRTAQVRLPSLQGPRPDVLSTVYQRDVQTASLVASMWTPLELNMAMYETLMTVSFPRRSRDIHPTCAEVPVLEKSRGMHAILLLFLLVLMCYFHDVTSNSDFLCFLAPSTLLFSRKLLLLIPFV